MPGKMHTVKIRLVDRKGERGCPNGQQIGDEWICEGCGVPAGGLCANAYVSMYPTIWMLQNGVELKNPDGTPHNMKLVCQDPNVMNVYEISVID